MNNYETRLNSLKAEIKKRGLDGFIVPRVSAYQGEFMPPEAERLAWLTGFTGSAGVAAVLAGKAAVFTDGRYTIQLAQQADKKIYALENSTKAPYARWIADNAAAGQVIGYDPWLHTPKQIDDMEKILSEKNIALRAVESNPVDAVWTDRPCAPAGQAELFPDDVAGSSSAQKREMIAKILREKKFFASVITMPDSLAWLLNVRGADVEYTPVVLSFGILYADTKVKWFVDEGKIPAAARAHLGKDVEICAPDTMGAALDVLAGKGTVALDHTRSPLWFLQRLQAAGAVVKDFADPTLKPKAIKSAAEQESLREAHIRDGVALVNFLCWLDESATTGKLSELDVVAKLEEFRRADNSYRGPSFATISGWARNGAVVHYRADETSNLAIKPPGLLLLDSGGQYLYGTTDITRTIAIGAPTEDMRRHFTLVLKGHIAIARARFPDGTTGAQIDALARQPLWAEGIDYAHGTGHGVGCYLSVHEESASISPRGREAIIPGMLISNEPGFYKEGAYGIRIENLVLARETGLATDTGLKLLEFETVSLVPIDCALIVREMMSADEREWLNDYHARVVKTLSPRLPDKVRAWLVSRVSLV